MSIYLLLAIGFKGGASVAKSGVDSHLVTSLIAGMVLSFVLPFVAYGLLRAMSSNRYSELRETLKTVTKMMGNVTDFSSFEYIFTRCNGREGKIHKQLNGLHRNTDDDQMVLKALLSDMIAKTTPRGTSINPLDDEDAPDYSIYLDPNSTPGVSAAYMIIRAKCPVWWVPE